MLAAVVGRDGEQGDPRGGLKRMAEDLGVRSERKARWDLGVTVARLLRERRARGRRAWLVGPVWQRGAGDALAALSARRGSGRLLGHVSGCWAAVLGFAGREGKEAGPDWAWVWFWVSSLFLPLFPFLFLTQTQAK